MKYNTCSMIYYLPHQACPQSIPAPLPLPISSTLVSGLLSTPHFYNTQHSTYVCWTYFVCLIFVLLGDSKTFLTTKIPNNITQWNDSDQASVLNKVSFLEFVWHKHSLSPTTVNKLLVFLQNLLHIQCSTFLFLWFKFQTYQLVCWQFQ